MEADGKISAVINFVDIDEDSEKIYGNAELCVMEFAETEDLMIGGRGLIMMRSSLLPVQHCHCISMSQITDGMP